MANCVTIYTLYAIVNVEYSGNLYLSDSWWDSYSSFVSINHLSLWSKIILWDFL